MNDSFKDSPGNSSQTPDNASEAVQGQDSGELATTEQEEFTQHVELDAEDAFGILQRDLASAHDKYVRLGAEFENYKKRSERERQSSVSFANERILTELLPVLDNMEHAVLAAQKGQASGEGGAELAAVVNGLNLVLKQFSAVLTKFGVSAFSAIGKEFDPNIHEAVAQRESESAAEGFVLEEYQKGYLLNDRLVRPARVVVAKAPIAHESE